MIIFPQKYIVRRFSTEIVRGSSRSISADIIVDADIQRSTQAVSAFQEGDRKTQTIKAWSDKRFKVDDQLAGEAADWIYNDGHWFKCISCQRSRNTLLDHYVSEFERVSEASEKNASKPAVEVTA